MFHETTENSDIRTRKLRIFKKTYTDASRSFFCVVSLYPSQFHPIAAPMLTDVI